MRKTLLIVLLISGFCFGQKYEGIDFYDNGKPKAIKTYKVSKNKIELIKTVKWHENGQKEDERTYKNGELDGLRTSWYENGQKSAEGTFKNGEFDALWTSWDENGQKRSEGTYKGVDKYGNPMRNGKWTSWSLYGQKKSERNYKGGELISAKCWDEGGNVQECR